jgi:hypothetical protein
LGESLRKKVYLGSHLDDAEHFRGELVRSLSDIQSGRVCFQSISLRAEQYGHLALLERQGLSAKNYEETVGC